MKNSQHLNRFCTDTIQFLFLWQMWWKKVSKTKWFLNLMLFSENLSLIAFIVHVAIVQGTDIINFRLLFFFSVNSTKSLLISPYFWKICLLEILTSFWPFLLSVEAILFVRFILCINWNFISTNDLLKFIYGF